DRLEPAQSLAAVCQNQQVWIRLPNCPKSFDHLCRDDSGFRNTDLVQHHDAVHLFRQPKKLFDQLRLHSGRGWSPVFLIQPVEFHRWTTRRNDQGFAIGEGMTLATRHKVFQLDARNLRKCTSQFKSFSVVSRKAKRIDAADSKGLEV